MMSLFPVSERIAQV